MCSFIGIDYQHHCSVTCLGTDALDIKSDNLLVSDKGTITLIDFGKIGFVGDHSVHRKGSHQTMSPEQRSHWHLTPKSDGIHLQLLYTKHFYTPLFPLLI